MLKNEFCDNQCQTCLGYRYCIKPFKRNREYKEILELKEYCDKLGIENTLVTMYDGYSIRFKKGGDFIQHQYSYGYDCGCVEPAIGSRLDYSAVELKKAKSLVKRWKDKL